MPRFARGSPRRRTPTRWAGRKPQSGAKRRSWLSCARGWRTSPRRRAAMTPTGFGVRFTLASLATWRLTHLLVEEDGPADVVVRLRARAGESWIGELMDCFYCLSTWVAAPLAVAVTPRRRDTPLVWLALSG